MGNLGYAYQHLTKSTKDPEDGRKSLRYFIEARKQRETQYGRNHPLFWNATNAVAVSLYYTGDDIDKALEYHKDVLKFRKTCCSKNNSQIAESYNNLADCYRAKGEYKNALKNYEDALKLRADNGSTDIEIVYK